jgi:hypothetical protein
VVGFNANKKYAVLPQQRVDLLREMVKSTSATNIQVEGTKLKLVAEGVGIKRLSYTPDVVFASRQRLHLEVRQE